ncbi:MAG TPA: 4Fe-4S dicluster domain-containing protein [Burkholderiales bacterium]|nr:4Fe-4S dicluster domain-containing protein [Burkholderiales bacterium]
MLCSCNRTMALDGQRLAQALGWPTAPRIDDELCRRHVASFEAAIKSGDDVVVACTQEAPLFSELHSELSARGRITFVNIRETAGWSAQARQATPKVAALLALASLPDPEPVPAVTYKSNGSVVIIGPAETALYWAERLADRLEVCVLFTDSGARAELPSERCYPVYSGSVKSVIGYLGNFELSWEQTNPIDLEVCTRCGACIEACPEHAIDYAYQIDLDKCRSHRKCVAACGEIHAIDFARAARARTDRFDLVLDLSIEPTIRLHQPPQGYFAPGRDPAEQALAVGRLAEMVGEFEKPKYFEYRQNVCAHSRSEIVGCRKCIDVCSTQAISSDVEQNRVQVEPHLCMGCGGCATVCPSGAMRYAYPRMPDMGIRLRTVLQTYREAGGRDACLLLHDTEGGRLVARLGRRRRGLPAHVIPLEVFHIGGIGPDLMLGALALGAAQVAILATGTEAPEYREALRREMAWAESVLAALGYGSGRLRLIEAENLAAFEPALWGWERQEETRPASFNFSDDKRTTLDFALDHLLRHAASPQHELPLPAGAPYGRVSVNRDTCTLCMACVGACPESALLDSKEAPQLRFIERNCVQCGLCAKTCPEDAITLSPRLLFTADAKREVVLNEAEAFACVKCGKPFGTKQMIESMVGRLGAHSMFAEAGALERLRMCADCRVVDLMHNSSQGSIFEW